MRSTIPTLSLLAIGMTLASCAPAEQAPAVDLEAEAEAIRARSQQWGQAVQARDAAAIAGLFAPDGEILERLMPPVQGRAAIQSYVEGEWAANPDFTVSWTITRVEVAVAGDMGAERGTWTFDPDGPGLAPSMQGEYLTVWTKGDDGMWYALADVGVQTSPEEEGA